MALFSRRSDPIAERTRVLNRQISELEERIKQLSDQNSAPTAPVQPRYQTPVPAPTPAPNPTPAVAPPRPKSAPPPSVAISRKSVASPAEEPNTAPPTEMYNEMGIRKFDLIGALGRISRLWKRRTPSNPNLVKYLASGGLPGMRALRYEKRVARNRFILLAVGITILLWIFLAAVLHNR